jgi:hypothetical protein
MAEKLTDRTAKTSSFANDDVIHVVDVSDTSQDPAGSSFKAAIGDIYGSYLSPKITSSQIITDADDTFTLTLADTTSSNHYLLLQTDSGDPFVDLTINSYANPKDGAIVVIRFNRAGTDDLIIFGAVVTYNGWNAGVYTWRYSTSIGSWTQVDYAPITGVVDFSDLRDVPSSYSGQGGKVVKVNAGATGLEFGSVIPKVYTALLTQTSTNAPVATILENTLGGTPVWTRGSTGTYSITLAGAFTVDKTVLFMTIHNNSSTPRIISEVNYGGSPNNDIRGVVIQDAVTNSNVDGLAALSCIEIRVYP